MCHMMWTCPARPLVCVRRLVAEEGLVETLVDTMLYTLGAITSHLVRPRGGSGGMHAAKPQLRCSGGTACALAWPSVHAPRQ